MKYERWSMVSTFSNIAFGTAHLHLVGSVREQHRLLDCAVKNGITHFDTAPLYGFGFSERLLGEHFDGDTSISIATKIGIYPPISRSLPHKAILGQKLLGKAIPYISRAKRNFDTAVATRSLEISLKSLRRDRLDVLLLHEPNQPELNPTGWEAWLKNHQSCISYFGVSGGLETLDIAKSISSPLPRFNQIEWGDARIKNRPDFDSALYSFGVFKDRSSHYESARELIAQAPTPGVIIGSKSVDRLNWYCAIANDLQGFSVDAS